LDGQRFYKVVGRVESCWALEALPERKSRHNQEGIDISTNQDEINDSLAFFLLITL